MNSSRLDLSLACALMSACFISGGSASRPDFEMGLCMLASLCLVASVWFGGERKHKTSPLKWVIGAIIALYILQLIPLPGLMRPVPGENVGSAVTSHSGWQVITLSPDATLYSLLSLVPVFVIMWLAESLSRSERAVLIDCVLMLAALDAAVGIIQAVGAIPFNLYAFYHPRVAVGLFASRNHFGDLFLLVTPLLFANRADWIERYGLYRAQLILHSLLLLFLAAVVASASRASIALFLPLTFVSYIITLRGSMRWRFLTIGVLVAAGGWLLVAQLPTTGVVKVAADRFEMTDDARWRIWDNSRRAAESLWPVGAGIGNFRMAYEAVEPVREITPSYINAAHNEYLQLLVEGGFLGLATAAFVTIVILAAFFKRRWDAKVTLSFIGLLGAAAHSIVDYPFRVIGLAVVIGLLCTLCVTEPPDRMASSQRRKLTPGTSLEP